MSTNVNPSGARDSGSSLYIGARRSLLPHGGKRSRSHVSAGLSTAQATRITRAGLVSIQAGLPFNRFVTVHWGTLGHGEAQSFKATSALMRLARDWLRDRGAEAVWLWVRENDNGDGSKGPHVHWLVHVPEAYRTAFLGRLQGWCVKAAGAHAYRSGALLSRPIGRHVDSWQTAPDTYRANLRAVLAYVLKGLDTKATKAASEGLNAIWDGYGQAIPNPGTGGLVSAKRVGFSRRLGALG